MTAENFFIHWPNIAAMKAATAYMEEFPKLTGFTVVSSTPLSSMLPNADSALLRGLFMENGVVGEGWQNRTQASDIIAEKDSDALRGVERVYDPSTNQVYEVPAGWYTEYEFHRGGYTMNDLQLLPADNLELWTSAPADGGAIH